MSDFSGSGLDIVNRYASISEIAESNYKSWRDTEETSSSELSFEDMLLLMVTQFQNQSIDNQASTTDMMNQLVQMTVMQAMTSMTTQMEELARANVMSYSASLVGKEVTVGVYQEDGTLQELIGTVTATGTYDGNQVIFIGEDSYLLSSIMAVGRLPEIKEEDLPGAEGEDGSTDETPPVDESEGTTDKDNPDSGTDAAGTGDGVTGN